MHKGALKVQNNYITLSGAGLDKTILLHRGNDEKHYLPRKAFSASKILSQFFYDQSLRIPPIFPILLHTEQYWERPFLWKDRFNGMII